MLFFEWYHGNVPFPINCNVLFKFRYNACFLRIRKVFNIPEPAQIFSYLLIASSSRIT